MTATDDDRPTVGDMQVTAYALAYEGDPLTEDDLGVTDVQEPDQALDLYRQAVRQAEAAAAVAKVLGSTLARTLGEGGAARYGNTIVRYRVGGNERMVGEAADYWDALDRLEAEDQVRVRDLFNPNDARKTPMPQALRDTFYRWEPHDAPSLASMPLDKAPKFLQELDEGDVIVGKRDGNEPSDNAPF